MDCAFFYGGFWDQLTNWPIPAANAQCDYQVRTYFDKCQVTDPTGLNA